ncbi:MAG: cohesin domain-containing protein [Bacteroidales bacterium]
MKTKLIKYISILFIIALPLLLQSQTINTSAGTVSECPGDIVVPINVTNCNGVGAISLVLQFNTSILTFLNYENINPQISSGFLIVNNSGDKVIISWANTNAANIGDGKLMDLRFSGITGSSSLSWNTQISGNCEYSDSNGNILPSSYTNGSVSVYQVPLITTQPSDKSVLEYQNATFSVGAIATGIQYQWYGSYNGGANWIELSNSSLYSGVTTANLTIYNTQLTYNGYLYRCEVTGTCSPPALTNAAMLIIIEPLISSFDVENVCPGTIAIPILTSNFNDVAAFSLAFSYNASVLTFSGFQGLNAALPPGNFVCNSVENKVYLSWSSTTPMTFSLPDTALVEILFTGLTGSSNLTWDTETAGNCEYTYLNAEEIASVFRTIHLPFYRFHKLIPNRLTGLSLKIQVPALVFRPLLRGLITSGRSALTMVVYGMTLSMEGIMVVLHRQLFP